MQLYYFHIFLPDGDIYDDVGTELASLDLVRLHMTAVAIALMDEKRMSEGGGEMEAIDSAGNIAMTMDFSVATNKVDRS